MRQRLITYLVASFLLAFLALFLAACGGGGDGSPSGTIPQPANSVVITGTSPETVAIAYDVATGKEAARDVADGSSETFSLSVPPGTYYLMFVRNEGTSSQESFGFRNVTGTNVFTFKANTTSDLGVLDFNNLDFLLLGSAVPRIDPFSGNDNVTESVMPEATFSPGDGRWTATTTFVNSTCPGHSPGSTLTEDVTIAHGFGIVTYTPDGTADTEVGIANVNTAIIDRKSSDALVTIYLTMQPDGSLAGTYSKVGYGGGCSEEGTLTAVLGTAPPPAAILTGLLINGPYTMSDSDTATYTATARWSDNTTSTVTPTWSVDSQLAQISTGGALSWQGGLTSDQRVMITATYSSGGTTEACTKYVTIAHGTIPFTNQELSGRIFFWGTDLAGSPSRVYILNADSSLKVYVTFGANAMHTLATGTWSIYPDGALHLDFFVADNGPLRVRRFTDSSTEMVVEVYDEAWGQWGFSARVETWEKTVPVDPSKLPGTYSDDDGYAWVFNNDGTGSVSIFGGTTFTWSVDSAGVLRLPFATGYTGVLYARASSQTTDTSYTSLMAAFAEHRTSTGIFYEYYGGIVLTRQ